MDEPTPPQTDPRQWYKKKRYLIPLGTAGFIIIAALNNGPAPATTTQPTPPPQVKSDFNLAPPPQQLAPAPTPAPTPAPQPQPTPTPSGCPTPAPAGYYTNVDGNCVPSPYRAPSPPSGATAQCRDGTYSFSQHRSGTCSHHGGVAQWLY